MTDAQRQAWIERLELGLFGQRRPEADAYAALYAARHRWVAAWLLGGVPLALGLAALSGSGALLLVLLLVWSAGGALLAWALGRRSPVWRWYFHGHAGWGRLSAVLPLATWRALQAEAAASADPAVRQLAARSWCDYRSALAALGRPAPEEPLLGRGFGQLVAWLPFS
ncbi:MAG: hypothetical protein ACK4MJ_10635 [Hylemonella sp.]